MIRMEIALILVLAFVAYIYFSAGRRPITALTRYLQQHLAEEVSLGVLAEEFHLSAQYISQLFYNEIGVNFLAAMPTTACSQRRSKRRRAPHRRSSAAIFLKRSYKRDCYPRLTRAHRTDSATFLPVKTVCPYQSRVSS